MCERVSYFGRLPLINYMTITRFFIKMENSLIKTIFIKKFNMKCNPMRENSCEMFAFSYPIIRWNWVILEAWVRQNLSTFKFLTIFQYFNRAVLMQPESFPFVCKPNISARIESLAFIGVGCAMERKIVLGATMKWCQIAKMSLVAPINSSAKTSPAYQVTSTVQVKLNAPMEVTNSTAVSIWTQKTLRNEINPMKLQNFQLWAVIQRPNSIVAVACAFPFQKCAIRSQIVLNSKTSLQRNADRMNAKWITVDVLINVWILRPASTVTVPMGMVQVFKSTSALKFKRFFSSDIKSKTIEPVKMWMSVPAWAHVRIFATILGDRLR